MAFFKASSYLKQNYILRRTTYKQLKKAMEMEVRQTVDLSKRPTYTYTQNNVYIKKPYQYPQEVVFVAQSLRTIDSASHFALFSPSTKTTSPIEVKTIILLIQNRNTHSSARYRADFVMNVMIMKRTIRIIHSINKNIIKLNERNTKYHPFLKNIDFITRILS